MIRFEDVAVRYRDEGPDVVSGLTLEIAEGETLVLLGASGCGKTTTLRLVNRMVEPAEGRVLLRGRDVRELDRTELRRDTGYVFQGIGLFPHLTVAANIGVMLRLAGRPREDCRRRAEELVGQVSLGADLLDRYPDELSGGQQQRVGVARALAADPEVLLMDEPFGALDALTRDALQGELIALKERLGRTIVFVTHDLLEALRVGDRIAVLREGRLEQHGTPEQIVNEPATAYVEELFAQPQRQSELLAELRDGGGEGD